MMVLVGAGLRIGEAFALRWRDVDLLAQPTRLNITRTWDPTSPDPITGARGVEVAVKTGEEGSVTIGERLLRELLDHKSALAASDDDLVFATRPGTHAHPSNFRTKGVPTHAREYQCQAGRGGPKAGPGKSDAPRPSPHLLLPCWSRRAQMSPPSLRRCVTRTSRRRCATTPTRSSTSEKQLPTPSTQSSGASATLFQVANRSQVFF